MQIIHADNDIAVCIKPTHVLSTDEPGGMPSLVREALGTQAVYTVHRLDRAVGGLMVLALRRSAARELSRQIREGEFHKEYVAAVHGYTEPSGTMTDLLRRDKARKMTFVADAPAKDVQEAVLDYTTLAQCDGLSCVRICLHTGRTHQIRCQFSSRGYPLVGDRKYGTLEDGDCDIALWSSKIELKHPWTGERLTFTANPPEQWPWNLFKIIA